MVYSRIVESKCSILCLYQVVTVLAQYQRVPRFAQLCLTASYGGTHDHLIEEFNLRSAKVVFSEAEAAELGLEIDHDDSHAAVTPRDNSFALLIHGTQPKGSAASVALKELKGQGSYSGGRKMIA